MQIPPVSIIAAWPPSNFTNPETRGPGAIITVSVLLGVVTILLGIRIYTRLWISKGFGLDDVLILLAYIPTTAFAIVSFVAQVDFHWGRHIWDLPFEDVVPSIQLNLSSQLLFDLSTSLTKLSMLSLIYRVVSVDKSRYRYAVILLAAIVAADSLIFFFIATFQCSPPQAYWTLSVTPQACINETKHLLAAGCINTTTDFLIVLVPIPYVRRLRLPRKQQIIVASLFAGGIFVTAAGAVRTAVTFISFSDPNKDLTWNAIPVIITSALELYVGIICASIPPIKPFFARYLPHLIGNPIYWLSRPSQSRATAGVSTDKGLEPDFWLITADRDSSHIYKDLESPPLVMHMRGQPPIPDMPTPVRPPRTQSTMRSISIHEPYQNMSYIPWSSTPSSIATTSTTILDYASLPAKMDLNKPLPAIRSTMLDGMSMPEGSSARQTASANMMSIYQFVPHEDGHISVHRAREADHGG